MRHLRLYNGGLVITSNRSSRNTDGRGSSTDLPKGLLKTLLRNWSLLTAIYVCPTYLLTLSSPPFTAFEDFEIFLDEFLVVVAEPGEVGV